MFTEHGVPNVGWYYILTVAWNGVLGKTAPEYCTVYINYIVPVRFKTWIMYPEHIPSKQNEIIVFSKNTFSHSEHYLKVSL